ncbi:MAG TPA: efflux RND transporter permease subunit [Beijerinckiaceae bacterium]|nr:efflux RND transporter permease subunit [Beijerinckiaceae bacterium]
MNVSAWSIRNPVAGILLFVVLSIIGINSFKALPITKMPNIDVPFISVVVTQGGAAPSELETQVTKKIEDAVANISGVKHITSSIGDGSSSTVIEFRLEVNTDRAVNDVKDAVARIRSDLPRSIDEPVVQRVDIEGLPILVYSAYAPQMTLEEISWYVDDTVIRTLQSIKGVGGVSRIGGVDREIRISLDPDRLAALGVTAGEVNGRVRATNVDLSGGRSDVAGREQSIRTLAGARSLEDLAATMIPLANGRKVRLDEIGRIEDSFVEQRSFARLDGKPVVAFAISRAKGASDAEIDVAVSAKIKELGARRPDVELALIDTSVRYTYGNFKSAMKTLVEGSLLAVAVVFLFLRNLRATLISAVAIPLSVLPTFWAMSLAGFSLNLVSLLALTLATGVLVDDAIVEIENIERHMHMGKSPYRASLEAADEIGLAVIAISATIIAVFVPVSFMSGIAGQYFKQFGLVVAVAVFFSLAVARLITPMMAAYLLRPPRHGGHGEGVQGPFTRGYLTVVRSSVRHRWITLFVGALLFAACIKSADYLPKGFFSEPDTARLLLGVELAPGSRLEETIRVSDAITARIKSWPEVKSVFIDGGKVAAAGATTKEVRKATIIVNLVHKSERTKTHNQLRAEISEGLREFADIRYWFMKDNGMRGVQMVVQGADGAEVSEHASRIASEMKRLPILANVVSTAALDRPEIRIRPKPGVAADLGITTDTISEAIRVATIGDVGPNLARFNAGDRLVPIRVQVEEGARGKLDVIEQLKVVSSRGVAVPLASVAEVTFGQGPTSIDRYDRARRVAVEADLHGTEALGEAVDAIRALPAAKALPPGLVLKEFGDAEIMGEVFSGFAQAMGLGLMMVLAVLILLFGSALQPITILASLPFSVGGVILALYLTNYPISMPVVIGILMLMGIVTKNAIMLVDFAVEAMARGVPQFEAIVDAGAKRARPIVMTTIAMIAGMVPSALALGDGGEFRAPMAIGVIGGLIVSTVLSLVFVPAVFTIMDDLGRLLGRLLAPLIGPKDEPGEAPPAALVVPPAAEAQAAAVQAAGKALRAAE